MNVTLANASSKRAHQCRNYHLDPLRAVLLNKCTDKMKRLIIKIQTYGTNWTVQKMVKVAKMIYQARFYNHPLLVICSQYNSPTIQTNCKSFNYRRSKNSSAVLPSKGNRLSLSRLRMMPVVCNQWLGVSQGNHRWVVLIAKMLRTTNLNSMLNLSKSNLIWTKRP